MKILFMGTPELAATCLKTLIDAKEEIAAVITQPDRPKGRGLKMSLPPVKEVAVKHSIPVYQPERIKDVSSIDLVKDIAPDLIVVVAYGKILPKEIIDAPKLGAINVHASLLPGYRGAAPIQWSILNGDKTTGITIMKVIEELDAGDIILQASVPILDEDNTSTLTEKIFKVGAKLLVQAVGDIKSGKVTYIAQDPKLVTLAPTLKKEDGIIDWKKPENEIVNKIRAFFPWPVAYTLLNGKMLKILSADAGLADENDRPGTVIECVKDEGFLVASGSGSVFVKEVQYEGGKRMKAWDFLSGHRLNPGDILPS